MDKVQALTARGFLTTSNGAKQLRELQMTLQSGEVLPNMEHAEPYGFTSEPIVSPQTDAFAIFFDGNRDNGVVLSFADRQFRIKNMKAGEVAIYDDQGQKVYFKRDEILIETPKNLTAKVSGNVVADVGGNTTVKCGGTIDATSPQTNIHGPLTVDGLIIGKGGLAISGGSGATVDGALKTTGDVQAGSISLQGHTHTGDSGGTTSVPK